MPILRCGVWLRASVAIALTAGVLAVLPDARADTTRQKRVLVLNSTRHDEQFSVVSEREVPKQLAEGLHENVDYYTEYLDFLRFPQPDYQSTYVDFLRLKYQGRRLDLLILMGDAAIEFVRRNRNILFTDVPAVFYSLNPPSAPIANSTGLINPLHFTG